MRRGGFNAELPLSHCRRESSGADQFAAAELQLSSSVGYKRQGAVL
jgi:hypothetical protein